MRGPLGERRATFRPGGWLYNCLKLSPPQSAELCDRQRRRPELSNRRLRLVLPHSHAVESASQPAHLSPALGLVQTTQTCWIVLRLTGQIVGTEEGGVEEAWQTLLQCGRDGQEVSTASFETVKKAMPTHPGAPF